ncbi:mechanosensitive ion channel family protein [Anaerocolumna xylanovorans]|uniref:mechanosensitive ion channel family protein n=1 Tax=Anaerocolumna xylanovorans TaxID=100134 RepID=UPI000936A29B|nr:mechanosensitive ion channel domain-containing protein [Anaerocolumna xylanovorans]
MVEYIKKQLIFQGVNEVWSVCITNGIMVLLIALISLALYTAVKRIVLKVMETVAAKSKTKWSDILLENRVLDRLIRIVPALVVHAFAPAFPAYRIWIQRIVLCYIIFVILLALDKLLDTVNDIYSNFEVSKVRPIKGYLQVIKIIAYIIGIIAIIGVLLNRSPWILLGSIGAASAVLLLVFQNSILGFVAGIQLTSNNMVQLGDWIEMPKYSADGEVKEISLHTVKVQNWDKTITTIPTYALVSESFKNWKGMEEAGGRRIKRSICIDMTSVRFCTEEMLERFGHIQYIKEYIKAKENEVESYNKEHGIDSTDMVNGRHLTNIGTFRAYVQSYLKSHPKIHPGMTQMVRQLEPTEKGIPIEIYVFVSGTAWANYESVQADIFDHILAVIPEFDLRIFQNPTGYDLKNITN